MIQHPVCLGRRPAVLDWRMPALAGHALASRPAPVRLIRDHVPLRPGLYANDRLGTCSTAGLANGFRSQTVLDGFDTEVTDDQAIAFYSGSTGYNPGDPSTDQGGVLTDVLRYQAHHGFQAEAPTAWVADWATIDIDDLNALRSVVAFAGFAYLGVSLSIADQNTAVWDADTPAVDGDPSPGSWGLHCLDLFAWNGSDDTSLVTLITWGSYQQATWRWLRRALDEAHALFYRQALAASGKNFAGIDGDKLAADNAAWAAA